MTNVSSQSLEAIVFIVVIIRWSDSEFCRHVGMQNLQRSGHRTLPLIHRRISSRPNSSPLCSYALVSVIVFPELSFPHSTPLDTSVSSSSVFFGCSFFSFQPAGSSLSRRLSSVLRNQFVAGASLDARTHLLRSQLAVGHSSGDLRSASPISCCLRASSQVDTRDATKHSIVQTGRKCARSHKQSLKHAHTRCSTSAAQTQDFWRATM